MASNHAVASRRWQAVRVLEVPCREASNVDVMVIGRVIQMTTIAFSGEFELEFITLRRAATYRAAGPDTRPSPQVLGEAAR
ncbi:MAG: hypothetical protein ACJ8R9_26710 [Steroidobacteraceae bacterium]